MKKLKLIVLLLVCTLVACQKDREPLKLSPNITIPQPQEQGSIDIATAKAIFYRNQDVLANNSFQYNLVNTDECIVFEPLWMMAQEIRTVDDIELVTVPLQMPATAVKYGRGVQLVFYPNADCDFSAQLVLYDAKDYDNTRPFPISNCSFTGVISVFDFCDCSSYIYPAIDGELTAAQEWSYDDFEECTSGADSRNDPDCPSWGPSFWERLGNFFSNVWSGIAGVFSGSNSGGAGDSSGDQWVWVGHNYGGFPYYSGGNYSNEESGGSTGSPTQINSIFDGTFFNGEGQLAMNILEDMIAENDLVICTEQLHQDLYQCVANSVSSGETVPNPGHQQCIDNAPDTDDELDINSYIYEINSMESSSSCLSNVIDNYQNADIDMIQGDGMLLCMVEENNNFDISDTDLFELIKDNCADDGDCVNDMIDCFGRLEEFQEEYGVTLNQVVLESILNNSSFDICSASNSDFEEVVNFIYTYKLPVSDLEELDFTDCLNSGDFAECAIIQLTDNMESCGEYDFIWCNNLSDSPNGICPESFKFQPTGTTYTCDIAKISFKYRGSINRTIYIGDLCISVTKKDIDGNNLTPYEASELMAEAWDEAQDMTATAFAAVNHNMTSAAYKNLFISNLRLNILAQFSGTFNSGAMSLINQNCSGVFPIGIPKYSFWC